MRNLHRFISYSWELVHDGIIIGDQYTRKHKEAVKVKFKLHIEQLSHELDEKLSQADRIIVNVKWKERQKALEIKPAAEK